MEYSEDGNELYSKIFFPELLESKESYMETLIEFRKQKPPSLQSLKRPVRNSLLNYLTFYHKVIFSSVLTNANY